MWRRASELGSSWQLHFRRFSTALSKRLEDEGDWFYSSEWWGTESNGQTVFRSTSDKGNGVVSVLAHPSSRPNVINWPDVERWLEKRCLEIYPGHEYREKLKVLGYQWRVLRFNDDTRQSAVKVMATYCKTEPASIHLMQHPNCLAVPYLKSMVSVGLAAIASCNYDITEAIQGKKSMHILCIGQGGGSLPLFLASKIQGAVVHIVEIDPLVISASIQYMGFPVFSAMNQSGQRVISEPDAINQVMWKGIHERLYLFESDAEKYILDDNTNTYDMVFVDAYDGEDIFPWKLWDPKSPFLEALSNRLHPSHGTVVVNLHSDSGVLSSDGVSSSVLEPVLPMGRYVSQVCQAYKTMLLGNERYNEGTECCNLGFTVEVPWVCNTSLVVCRGFGIGRDIINRDLVVHALISKSFALERMMNLPFSCLQYIKRGFILMD